MMKHYTEALRNTKTHDGAIVISDTAYHRLQWCAIGAGITTKVIGLVALGFLFAGCVGTANITTPPMVAQALL